MSVCANCGHELGAGRFCTNCGHPIGAPAPAQQGDQDWRTDTAERPAVPADATPPPPPPPPPSVPPPSVPRPSVPPPYPPPVPPPAPAGSVPPARPRFPLFADEAGEPSAPTPPAPPTYDATLTAQLPVPPQPGPATHRRSRPWGLWIAMACLLAVIAGLGIWLATAGGDEEGGAAQRTGGHRSGAQPSNPGHSSSQVPAGDVTRDAEVQVPATAPPNQDTEGNPVDYGPTNMTDGVPETCWRMPGDGSGREITITLPARTHLRSVGLINGYAKSATDAQGRTLDWYHGNRRITSVEWVFDDGSTVPQRLDDTTAVQSVDVDVTTATVTLRLVDVSRPGPGPAARNYTAISDLSLVSAG